MDLSGQITLAVQATASSNVYLSGQIAATTTAWVSFAGSGPFLSGTITTATAGNTALLREGLVQILAGVIASTTVARFGIATPLSLSGRINASFAARATFPGGGPFLAGRITATVAAQSWGPDPLRGQIAISTTARVNPTITGLLTGVIASTSAAILSGRFPISLSGRITATSAASITPTIYLSGQITATSAATWALAPTAYLGGQITATSAANFYGIFIPIQYLAGTIASSVTVLTDYLMPVEMSGVIATATGAGTDWTLASYFSGQISFTVTASGFAGPWFGLIGGTATTSVQALFGDEIGAELIQPLPPYPPPFPTWPVEHYLSFITSEHNQRLKYMSTIGMTVEPYVAEQTLSAALPGLFDLDYSIGEQEDFTGEWIGKSRWLELPAGFFSWDYEGLGWNQANWQGPFDAPSKLQRLDDYHYRLLLYAAVIANHWDGSIPKAYEAWDTLFHYTGLQVVIQDFGDMTMMYGLMWTTPPDQVLVSLFTTGEMDLKPEGIELIDYVFQDTPGAAFFGFDADTNAVSGWDSGAWGKLVPPSLAVGPIQATEGS